MFLHVSVILSTGGSTPLHAGIHPPGAGTPLGADPPDQKQVSPWEQTPPGPEAGTPTPLGADTPQSRDPPGANTSQE